MEKKNNAVLHLFFLGGIQKSDFVCECSIKSLFGRKISFRFKAGRVACGEIDFFRETTFGRGVGK